MKKMQWHWSREQQQERYVYRNGDVVEATSGDGELQERAVTALQVETVSCGGGTVSTIELQSSNGQGAAVAANCREQWWRKAAAKQVVVRSCSGAVMTRCREE